MKDLLLTVAFTLIIAGMVSCSRHAGYEQGYTEGRTDLVASGYAPHAGIPACHVMAGYATFTTDGVKRYHLVCFADDEPDGAPPYVIMVDEQQWRDHTDEMGMPWP